MADRESRVKLSVVDNFSGPLAKFAGGMSGAYAGVQGLKQGLQTLAGGGGGVAGAVIKTVIDATKYTIQWAGEIDTLSRITGTGARETSKLAIVFGDVGIGMDVLRASARKMASEGLELNFQSMVKLAKEYQALPPGLERSRFAMEKFGRAGVDMSEILDRDISEIEALGRAAEKSGKIIGDDFVKKAEKLETGMHQLQDRMEGFKLFVGGLVLETVNKAAVAFDDYVGIYQALWIKAQQVTGALDDQEAAIQAAMLTGESYGETLKGLGYDMETADYATRHATDSVATLSASYAPLGAGAMDAAYWIDQGALAEANAKVRADELTMTNSILAAGLSGPLADAADMTAAAFERATAQLIYQQLAADLDAQAAFNLAKTLGLIDPASAAAAQAALLLKQEYDAGKLSAGGYADAAKGLADAINALQDRKVTITVDSIRNEIVNKVYQETAEARERQFGGLVPAMQTMLVGERGPELLRLDRPGRIQSDTAGGSTNGNAPMATEILAALRALPLQMKLALRGA